MAHPSKAEQIALQLMEKFNDNGGKDKLFFLKVGNKLSEHKIWELYEIAKFGRTPIKLFSSLCKREMDRLKQWFVIL